MLVAAFYPLTEPMARSFGALPFLLILTCPLMHLFQHRGDGRNHEQAMPLWLWMTKPSFAFVRSAPVRPHALPQR
jgi:hypothetical protein